MKDKWIILVNMCYIRNFSRSMITLYQLSNQFKIYGRKLQRKIVIIQKIKIILRQTARSDRLTNDREVHFKAHKLQKLEPIHVRHVHIADNQIKLVFVLPQRLQCSDCLVGYCHWKTINNRCLNLFFSNKRNGKDAHLLGSMKQINSNPICIFKINMNQERK